MIRRYMDRDSQGYWVHVDASDVQPPEVDRPFHLLYGPYRFGIYALLKLWVITVGVA